MLPRCKQCDAPHDPRPCARDGVMCACCADIYPGRDERDADCERLDSP